MSESIEYDGVVEVNNDFFFHILFNAFYSGACITWIPFSSLSLLAKIPVIEIVGVTERSTKALNQIMTVNTQNGH